MSKTLSASLWALAIIFAAWLASTGSIEKDNASLLMLILPLLATLQLSGVQRAHSCKGAPRNV